MADAREICIWCVHAVDPKQRVADDPGGLPARLEEGSKFTLSRIEELEPQIAHVGRLHQKLALARGLGGGVKREPPDDNQRRLVILPRMPPADEPINGVRYIGVMSDGKHVYENSCRKSRACFTRAR